MKLSDIRYRATQFNYVLIVLLVFLLSDCGGGGPGVTPHLNWTQKTAMPTARAMLSSGVVNGKIYAIGGYTGSYSSATIVGAVEEYDPATDTWKPRASMTTARTGLVSAVVNNVIYAIGGGAAAAAAHTGNCNGNCSTVEAYDPATDTWTPKTPAFTQRNGMTSSAVGGIIYVMGGCCSISTVEAYDAVLDTWTTRASMPTAREGLTSAAVNGKIYAIGGGPRNASNNVVPTGIVEEYDPATNTWATKASMPTAREGLISAVVNGKIYAIGGFNGTPLSTVEVYDPVVNTWSSLSSNYSMPTPRNQFASEVINGIIYAIGGYGMTSLSTVEAFTPP